MKTVTIHVDEAVYAEFQKHARRLERSTSDLIREAMCQYNERLGLARRPSLRDAPLPVSVGKVQDWKTRGELLEGFFDRV